MSGFGVGIMCMQAVLLLGGLSSQLPLDDGGQAWFEREAGNGQMAAVNETAAVVGQPWYYSDQTDIERTSERDSLREWNSLEGIALDANKDQVATLLGEPDRIEQDPHIKGREAWTYSHTEIGFYHNNVEYISVQAAAQEAAINGTSLEMERKVLETKLGIPTFEAEDGIVYVRGHTVLKLFLDPETGEGRSLDMYTLSVV